MLDSVFVKKRSTPNSKLLLFCSGSESAVKKIMGISLVDGVDLSSLTISNPLTFGIIISLRIRSGDSEIALARPSSPSSAVEISKPSATRRMAKILR